MINAENDAQPSRSNPVWTKGRIRWLWQTVPIALFLIGVIILTSYFDAQQKSLLRQYQASPNCVSNSSTLKTLSPCTRTAMQITVKRYYHNTKSRDDYFLTLRTPGGGTKEVSLHGHMLWDKSRVGDTVTAKSWRGKIVLVTGYGYSPMTDDYPRADSFSSAYCNTMCMIGLVVLGFVIVKGWREDSTTTDAKNNPSKVQ